jgi:hypothetical protein
VRKERSATDKKNESEINEALGGRRERAYVEPNEGSTGSDRSHAAAIDDAEDKVQRGQTKQDECEYPKLEKTRQAKPSQESSVSVKHDKRR